MWTPPYDIIVETLTGSEIEVTVNERDTIGYIKSKIQEYEGIPAHQQHLLYNHKELTDAIEMKDIPLVNGSRIKLVLGLRGGPISSKRVVSLPDYDGWFDFSDVLSRQDSLSVKTPGVKLLLYKDNKKNIQRVMKMRGEKINKSVRGAKSTASLPPIPTEPNHEQWYKDNFVTFEKMNILKSKIRMKKKNFGDLNKYNTEELPGTQVKFPADCENIKTPTLSKNETEPYLDIDKFNNMTYFDEKIMGNLIDKPYSTSLLRNRSFDLFDLNNERCYDVLVRQKQIKNHNKSQKYHPFSERSLSFQANGENMSGPSDELAVGDNNVKQKCLTSSVCDIIEILKYNPNKLRTMSNDAINKIVSAKKNSKTNVNHNEEQNISNIKNIEEYVRDYEIPVSNCILTPKLSPSSDIENKLKTTVVLSQENRTISEEIDFENDVLGAGINGESSDGTFTGGSASASGLDSSFRLYKNSSKESNCSNCNYELPKLLIREDSPVESYHLSDIQLETLTLLSSTGEKSQRFNSFPKLDSANDTSSNFNFKSNNDKNISTESLLQFYPSQSNNPNNGWNSDLGLNELELKFLNGEFINTNNKSDNNISNFLYTNQNSNKNHSIIKFPSHPSNLEINHWHWDNSASESVIKEDLFDKDPINSSTLSLTSSSSYTTIDDEDDDDDDLVDLSDDDVTNLAPCKAYLNLTLYNNNKEKRKKKTIFSNSNNNNNNVNHNKINNFNIKTKIKSKSIDLNECRKKFGSSPTLLNSSISSTVTTPTASTINTVTQYTNESCSKNIIGRKKKIAKTKKTISNNNLLIPQPSRLDAIPSQYRRGYTNLNDAFLSSSTSDLERNHSNHPRHRSKHHLQNQNLLNFNLNNSLNSSSPLLKHRTNNHLEYVRSYDNLNHSNVSGNNHINNSNTKSDRNDLNISNGTNVSNDSNDDYESIEDEDEEENENDDCDAGDDEDETKYGHKYDHKYVDYAEFLEQDSDSDIDEEILNSLFSKITLKNINAKESSNTNSDESLFSMKFDEYLDEYIDIDGYGSAVNSLKTTSTPSLYLESNPISTKQQSSLMLPDINPSMSSAEILKNSSPKIPLPINKEECDKAVDDEDSRRNTDKNKKIDKQRCAKCNKKLGVIMIMKCHCERVFCAQHRYAETHNCTYDYKMEGKKILQRDNPLVVGQKLPKI